MSFSVSRESGYLLALAEVSVSTEPVVCSVVCVAQDIVKRIMAGTASNKESLAQRMLSGQWRRRVVFLTSLDPGVTKSRVLPFLWYTENIPITKSQDFLSVFLYRLTYQISLVLIWKDNTGHKGVKSKAPVKAGKE